MTKTKTGAEHFDPAVPIQNVIPVAIGPRIAPRAKYSSRLRRLHVVCVGIPERMRAVQSVL